MESNGTTTLKRESIASRHARLYDRNQKSSVSENLTRIVAGVLIVGAIFASLYFTTT